MEEAESQVLRDLEEMIGETVPRIRSIKSGTTGLYSIGYVEGEGKVIALSLSRVVKVGVLKNFIEFRGRFLPRYMFVER